MRYEKIPFEFLLEQVEKPGRYTDSEVNAYHKQPDAESICFCLAYPDVYEVGFSHQGIKILYSILNSQSGCMADRVFAPWPDLGSALQQHELPLFALESQAAVRDFDVLGITLQSELTYTNILYLLDLAKIPLDAGERTDKDPLLLAGGPCAANPEPLSDFIDVFLIGDGEEAILEIQDCLKRTKHLSRREKLAELAAIEGIYVPLFPPEGKKQIRARKYMDFSTANPAGDQLVPWLQPTHDRLSVEIMRGCSRGCRFCHAGYFYRPVREKSPENIKTVISEQVDKCGWEEVGLTSLSSSDYSQIRELLTQLWEITGCHDTKLSLPSLRVDSLDNTLTSLMNKMQQKSVTIAPEAGSQRLRDIINKNFSEEDILRGVKAALANGWRVLKLYFMIGLPFELDEDIEAIADLVEKIVSTAGRKLQINITVSPFVPKPFTPFQWAKAADPGSLMDKVHYLKHRIKQYKFIKLKYHTIEYQALECVLGRGDRKVGALLKAAYKAGAIYDGWDEFFDYSFWQEAEQKTGLDIQSYCLEIPLDSPLPWDHISLGLSKEFFIREYQKAEKGITTEDCRDSCSACGLCDDKIKPVYHKTIDPPPEMSEPQEFRGEPSSFRVFYEKGLEVRYIGHLDMLRMTYRLVRASGLPVLYSIGFNKHPQVSFGPPLPLGMTSKCEYFDLKLADEKLTNEEVYLRLSEVFPPGMRLQKVISPVTKAMRSMEYYPEEEVVLKIPEKKIDFFEMKVKEFDQEKKWQFIRERKRKQKLVDLKELVTKLACKDNCLIVHKRVSGASIFDILKHVFEIERQDTAGLYITRTKLF